MLNLPRHKWLEKSGSNPSRLEKLRPEHFPDRERKQPPASGVRSGTRLHLGGLGDLWVSFWPARQKVIRPPFGFRKGAAHFFNFSAPGWAGNSPDFPSRRHFLSGHGHDQPTIWPHRIRANCPAFPPTSWDSRRESRRGTATTARKILHR